MGITFSLKTLTFNGPFLIKTNAEIRRIRSRFCFPFFQKIYVEASFKRVLKFLKYYSGDPKTGHSKTGRFEGRFFLMLIDKMAAILSITIRKPDIFVNYHSKTGPFHNPTALDHSKTRHVRFSSPNCIDEKRQFFELAK